MSEYKNAALHRLKKNIEHPHHDWEPGPFIEIASWLTALAVIAGLVYIVWQVFQ